MAVNEGLTVFNLVDGVVDEFNDESGTDEAEGSNDTYDASNDFYANYTVVPAAISAGFSLTTVTEPDTSSAGTNPAQGDGSPGTFTVPCGMTSMSVKLWGSGGGGGGTSPQQPDGASGGGGGFVSGNVAVTGGQTIYVIAGEGGINGPTSTGSSFGGDHPDDSGEPAGNRSGFSFPGTMSAGLAGGGGLSAVSDALLQQPVAPQVFLVAGSGGGGADDGPGGAGGGLTGQAGGAGAEETVSGGQGGSQCAGGVSGPFGCTPMAPNPDYSGGLFYGGKSLGGGAGYYGGGAGGDAPGNAHAGGGGGSSFYGHPLVTSGTTNGGSGQSGGGTGQPTYVAGTNEGAGVNAAGEDGYVLITGSYCAVGSTTSTTIVSTAFTSTSVATNSRIVVFEENVDTPTLNTDIIASVSRDGGTTFTNATLSDSGYVTGSSGQRILTGQADISGQPSGQSMRWKLALANNKVKIHGVSLQWS